MNGRVGTHSSMFAAYFPGEPYPVCSRHTRKPLVSMHTINIALDAEGANRA